MEDDIKKNTNTVNKIEQKDLLNPDFAIIDEYFANGYNGTKAVMTVKPHISYSYARFESSRIMSDTANKEYIARKRYELSINANVTINDLVNELKGFAFADITQFMGLSEDDVKALEPQQRRHIKKITTNEKVFQDKNGNTTTDISTTYELNDKIKAIDMLGKHLGIYEVHNQQKQKVINLNDATPEQLNAILSLVEQQKDTNKHGAN